MVFHKGSPGAVLSVFLRTRAYWNPTSGLANSEVSDLGPLTGLARVKFKVALHAALFHAAYPRSNDQAHARHARCI
jgi:hypothetical protein